MPVRNKRFIGFHIRSINPLPNLDLTPVCFWTFMNLKEITETAIFIITSQRKQPAESRTCLMNAASSPGIEKYTLLPGSRHTKMRKNISVKNIQCDFPSDQLLRCLFQEYRKPVNIQGIQHYRISHPTAAVTAALTIMAVCFYHIICIIQFSIGYLT